MSYNVEATVDGIKFLYDGGEVEVDYNASDGDVVRLTIEPLEVKVTDGFRAAVKKACNCDSSSGGGGGGPLIVHSIVDGDTHTLDKTFQEIYDALSFVVLEGGEGGDMFGYVYGYPMTIEYDGETYSLTVKINGMSPEYATDSVDGYPSYTDVLLH